MAKLNFLKRLIVEDFKKDDRDLVSKLAAILNPALEGITDSLNNGLKVSDLNAQVKEFTVKVGSDGVPTVPTAFKSTLNGQCIGMSVIRVIPTSGRIFAAPFVSYSENQGVITVLHVTGLPADTNCLIKVLAYA